MSTFKRRRRKRGLIPLILLLAVLILFADSNMRIVTTEYEIASPDLPAQFDGYRIAVVSDMHESYSSERGLVYFISAVRAAKPDIIAVLGDMVTSPGKSGYVHQIISALAEVAPVYFVTGNHDWAYGDATELLSAVKNAGGTLLLDTFVTLERGGAEITLAGVNDPNGPRDGKKPGELAEELREAGAGYTVLLAHRNNSLELYRAIPADLTISGHAHGGVIRLPFTDGLIGPDRNFLPTHTSGIYREDGRTLLVSRGVGNSPARVLRLFNNPQIPVAVLRAG